MKKQIGFIGLGKLGMPVAEVISVAGHNVIGCDINTTPSQFNSTNNIEGLVNHDLDFIFIAVQTPHHKDYDGSKPTSDLPVKDFDYSIVKDLLTEINQHISKQTTIVLISTVLPGTVRRELATVLSKGTKLIYNPFLIAMTTVKEDFINPEMVIMGSENGDKEDFIELIDFYKSICPTRPMNQTVRIETGTWEEAESIKIFYNTFISTKLALVNMVQDVAESLGNMNVDVVTNALAHSNKRIMSPAYMKAGMGDGGGCHPRDNIALSWLAKDLDLGYDLFKGVMHSREQQAKRLAEMLESFNNPVVILGRNYKPNSELEDGSYSLLVGHYIDRVVYDEAEYDTPVTYLLSHENVYNDYEFNQSSVIVDPWRSFKTDRKDLTVVYYGSY
jgi:UDPglucose 6-dehydrogenase